MAFTEKQAKNEKQTDDVEFFCLRADTLRFVVVEQSETHDEVWEAIADFATPEQAMNYMAECGDNSMRLIDTEELDDDE